MSKDFKKHQIAVRHDYKTVRGEVSVEPGLTVMKVAMAIYDFSKHGGDQGDIGLGVYLPKNAIVRNAYAHAIEEFTSDGSATLAFKAATAGDLVGTTDKGDLGTGDLVDGAADGDATNMVLLDEEKEITATIATADATAGKVAVFVEYFISQ